jgi:hypothetical protein
MKQVKEWPYSNKSLKDLRGERWDDVPGFGELYQVSSYGRMKSLRRWRASGLNGGGYYTKEKILSQGLQESMNNLVLEPTYCLNIGLKQPGRSISRSTARYVYCVFVKSFDLDNKDLIVSYKDGGRNLHYSNLVLTDRSKLIKKSFRLGRHESTFTDARLPVRQLTMEGKLVATYASIKEAQDKTGFFFTAIAACIEGRTYQSHGFRWESPEKPRKRPVDKVKGKGLFNQYLWERLGRPRTSRSSPMTCLNLSPEDMPGGKWKELEGTEGAYQVSNLGRVKGLPRFKNQHMHVWTKGRIKRLVPDGSGSQPISCLLCSLSHKGKKYQQSVARLVYHHFVEQIDLSGKINRIKYRNKKCYDLKWKNLFI